MRLKDFVNRLEISNIEKSLRAELTSLEKKLLETQDLVEVRGKLGRGVPVIIPQDTIQVMKYLADEKVRRKAGIPQENTFLFANSSLGVLRAYDSLKFCCGQVSLKNPDRITSVNLRKYTATIAQKLQAVYLTYRRKMSQRQRREARVLMIMKEKIWMTMQL